MVGNAYNATEFSCLVFFLHGLCECLPQKARDRGHPPQMWKAATGKDLKNSVVSFSWSFFLSPTFLCLFCLIILMSAVLSPFFLRPFVVISCACWLIFLFSWSFPIPHLNVSAAFHHPLTADEMTVGKVYAALMIFDFYKQNKNSREQVHQPPGGLCQVLSQKASFLVLPLGQPLRQCWAAPTRVTGMFHPESLDASPGRVWKCCLKNGNLSWKFLSLKKYKLKKLLQLPFPVGLERSFPKIVKWRLTV